MAAEGNTNVTHKVGREMIIDLSIVNSPHFLEGLTTDNAIVAGLRNDFVHSGEFNNKINAAEKERQKFVAATVFIRACKARSENRPLTLDDISDLPLTPLSNFGTPNGQHHPNSYQPNHSSIPAAAYPRVSGLPVSWDADEIDSKFQEMFDHVEDREDEVRDAKRQRISDDFAEVGPYTITTGGPATAKEQALLAANASPRFLGLLAQRLMANGETRETIIDAVLGHIPDPSLNFSENEEDPAGAGAEQED